MHRALPEILEPLDELERRLSQCRDAYQKPRLHLLVLLARGEVRRRENAAQRLAYHRTPSVSGCGRMRIPEHSGSGALLVQKRLRTAKKIAQ